MTKEFKIMGAIATVLIAGGVLLILSQNPNSENGSEKIYDRQILVGAQSYHTNPAGTAKVTVVEFGDFQCPACAVAEQTVKQMLEAEKNNPNFDFVYRHLPLPQHANAVVTAKAAEAAGEQGKFWEMYALLYEKQAEWSEQKDPMPTLENYAGVLGLNIDQFKAAISGDKFESKIFGDTRDAQSAEINSTPTFFINGKKFIGVPGTDFVNYLQSELTK